ncbi:hypothetical protein FA15DRAFT_674995, partial [Coprinopsis marcescibilis]
MHPDRKVVNDGVEDDDMPPLVDNPAHYTFVADAGHLSLSKIESSQVTPSTVTITSPTSNAAATDFLVTTSSTTTSPPPSPLTSEDQAMPSSSRSRSKPRAPQVKRRDSTHIPRPPNAFILFRSAFIRSQQIPDRVEGNHSNLSKIIGHYWKTLPPEERAEWEAKALEAQESHRQQYPDWRFRPGPYALGKLKTKDGTTSSKRRNTVSSSRSQPDSPIASSSASPIDKKEVEPKGRGKGKAKEREGSGRSVEDRELRDTRCVQIANLLVAGKKGSDLANAVEEWEGVAKGGPKAPSIDVSDQSSSGSRSLNASPSTYLAQIPDHFHPTSPASPDPRRRSPRTSSQQSTTGNEAKRAPIKGISDVPLNQMFVRQTPGHGSHPISNVRGPPPAVHLPVPLQQIANTNMAPSTKESSLWRTDPRYESPTFQSSNWWNGSPSSSVLDRNEQAQLAGKPIGPGHRSQLGYEHSWASYDKLYGSMEDPPPDGSDAANWTTDPTRQGFITSMRDPCLEDDESGLSGTLPGSILSRDFSRAVASPNMSTSERTQAPFLYPAPHNMVPSLCIPPTSFSTLTGWAGAFDPSGSHSRSASVQPSPLSGWFSAPAEWPIQQGHHVALARGPDDWDALETSVHHHHPHPGS